MLKESWARPWKGLPGRMLQPQPHQGQDARGCEGNAQRDVGPREGKRGVAAGHGGGKERLALFWKMVSMNVIRCNQNGIN